MGTFRPPMHAQQCPVCSVPHFPFCISNRVFDPHRHQHYSGQAGPHRQYEALYPEQSLGSRPPNAMPEPGFRSGNFLLPESPFLQGQDRLFQGDNRDRFPQVPSGVSFPAASQYHAAKYQQPEEQHFNPYGIKNIDVIRQEATNSWLDPRREIYFQQQRRVSESVSGFPIAERDFRAEFHRIPGDAKVTRDEKWTNNGSESLAGLSNGRNEFLPGNDGFLEGPHSSRAEYQQGKALVKQIDHFTRWPHSSAGSYVHEEIPGFIQDRAQKPDASRFPIAGTGTFTAIDENQKHHHSGPPQGIEGIRVERGLFAGESMSREEQLIRQHDLQVEPYEKEQEHSDYAQIKNLKRTHPVTGKKCLSREEELLIEKGLIEDVIVGPNTWQPSLYQADGKDEFMPRGKQARFEATWHNQSNLPASEKELCSTRMAYEDDVRVQSLNVQNERRKMEEDKGVGLKHWPSGEYCDRVTTWDAPLDERKSFMSDSVHLRGGDSSSNNLAVKSFNQEFEGRLKNNDHLFRQYQEWEAEAQHMEALKRAEKIAREIQQRDQKKGSPTSQTEELMKGQAFEHHASRLKSENTLPVSLVYSSGLQWNQQGRINEVQSTKQFSKQLHSLAEERQGFTNIVQPGGGQDSWQQGAVDNLPASSVQSLKPHSGAQQHPQDSSPYVDWQNQGHLQDTQHSAHHDQQSTCLHSYYSKSGVWEALYKTSDRNANALHAGHEVPPLPVGASIDPPPPDSPPPPLPPSCVRPSPDITSARPPVYTHQSQILGFPFEGQSFGQHEPHQSRHIGASEVHLSHFQAQASQQLEKLKVVDAVNILRKPGRTSRPDRFVVILRGLSGSGKSYLAKALRDVEIMNGGSAPRIHSMDDYFTCEVEKEDEVETGPSSLRTKKKVLKRVMEYCYEPEMEEAYRVSMLKAFKKTLDEGMFKFVIVDDRNVLIADFAQFWAIAKRSGYEAYILEAPYTDVKGCAARNVHGFTEQQIQAMADRWEPTPSLYLRLDVSSLFRADDLNAQDIIEVDMDADDMEGDFEEEECKTAESQDRFLVAKERPVIGDRWEDKVDDAEEAVSAAKAKSSIRDRENSSGSKKKAADNALSGLMTMYGKKDKFVHWPDNQGQKGSSIGFSIGSTARKRGSLIIGPGPGYNGISNLPLAGDDSSMEVPSFKKRSKVVEQLRAEQEAFKAVFTRRRQRIRGMDEEDDD